MVMWHICPAGQEKTVSVDWLEEIFPHMQLRVFAHELPSLQELTAPPPQVVLISLTGQAERALLLASALRMLIPTVQLIFSEDVDRHGFAVMRHGAVDYLPEPLSRMDVMRALVRLRDIVDRFAHAGGDAHVRVQTFGNFEVFVDHEPLHFPRTVSKELLAYLIDRRGAGCTLGELAAVLWEEKERSRSLNSQVQTAISTMQQVLREAGADDVICRTHNAISVRCDRVRCDLYDFLAGEPYAVRQYTGEYMRNYSWAEYTAGWLSSRRAEVLQL